MDLSTIENLTWENNQVEKQNMAPSCLPALQSSLETEMLN